MNTNFTMVLITFLCMFFIFISLIYFIFCFVSYLVKMKKRSKVDMLAYSILILACLAKLSLTSVCLAAAIMQDQNVVDYITTHGNFISSIYILPKNVSNILILMGCELNAYKLIRTIIILKMLRFNPETIWLMRISSVILCLIQMSVIVFGVYSMSFDVSVQIFAEVSFSLFNCLIEYLDFHLLQIVLASSVDNLHLCHLLLLHIHKS